MRLPLVGQFLDAPPYRVGEGLHHDLTRHFRMSQPSISKDNGQFANGKPEPLSLKDRLDLEGVSPQLDALQVKRGQYRSPVALIAGGTIAHGKPKDRTSEYIAATADNSARPLPVRRCPARHVA